MLKAITLREDELNTLYEIITKRKEHELVIEQERRAKSGFAPKVVFAAHAEKRLLHLL